MRKRLFTTGKILFLLSAMILAVPGHAEEPLTLSTGDDYPPFSDVRLPGGGIATQIVTAVMEETGLPYRIDVMPWPRAYELALRGKYTASFAWFESQERRSRMLYSEPIATVLSKAFMAKGRAGGKTNISQLEGAVFCVPHGYTVIVPVLEMVELGLAQVSSPTDLTACLNMVKAGHVDVVVGSERVLLYLAGQMGMGKGDFDILEDVVAASPLHMLAPRDQDGSAEFIRRFNTSLKKLKEAKKLDQFLN